MQVTTSHKNQSGGAVLIIVMVLTFSSVLLFGLLFNYIVTRAKYHGRIKESYQISNVMEDFAKTTRQAYDTAVSTLGANCPDGRPKSNTVGITGGLELCFPPCPNPPVPGAPACNPAIGDLCITNLGRYYCMIPELNPIVQKPQNIKRFYVQKIDIDKNSINKEKLDRWYQRIEAFYFEKSVQFENSKLYSWIYKNLNYQPQILDNYSQLIFENTYAMSIADAISICVGGGPGAGSACNFLNSNVQMCIDTPAHPGCTMLRNRCMDGGAIVNLVPNCSLFPTPSPSPIASPSPHPSPTALPTPPVPPPSECFTIPGDEDEIPHWRVLCSGYCDHFPSLPVCQDLPAIGEYSAVECPMPPAPQPAVCQGCGSNENCIEMGYCLEPPCDSLGSGYLFKQVIKLIIN